jgi:phenylalanyl-tRNA synthetase beta chain
MAIKIPMSWLREYVEVDATTREIAERLAISTFELETITSRGVPDVDGNLGFFRVGRVLEAGKHPNADRLQLCKVDVGESEPRQIVCGAWNFGAGATVAVALPGAILPGAERPLEQAKLRGELSDGMILSERELELGSDHSGIIVLSTSPDPGTPLVDVLPLLDEVIEAETSFNRPDLLSIYGIAREVAAVFNAELKRPPGREPPRPASPEPVDVTIEDTVGCPRYIGRLFRDARVGPSPEWLKARLAAAGMRSISNAVDVTNYVMLALGNPLHAFDRSKLAQGRIVVRRATPGEELVTLDGEHRKLESSDLVIADAERAIALAGIMGGEETEVTDTTEDILLEAANFEPVGIMRSSERLALRTEGSNRWEKGVDPYLAEQAAIYATELLVELTKASYVGETDAQGDLPARPVTRLRPERTDAVAGVTIPVAEQPRILERLGFEVEEPAGVVTVPTWRARDVTREIDVVEEVIRIHGLEKVPFTLPLRREMFGRLTNEQRLRRVCEDVLVGAGLCEAYTPALVSDGELKLLNPMHAGQSSLRTTLLQGLVESAERNVNAGNDDIALFEIARVFLAGPLELPRLGGIVEGDFARVKGVLETLYAALRVELTVERTQEPWLHPGTAARTEAGWFGELHPARLEGQWGVFELDLETLFAGVQPVPLYADVITYPPVRQDLALTVGEEVAAGDLVAAAREAAGEELREARIFDVYRGEQVGEGKKSVALSLVFQSAERTLSDEEAGSLRTRIVDALADRFGAELRGG